MSTFTAFRCLVVSSLCRYLMLGDLFVHASMEPSEDKKLKPPAFMENRYFPSLTLSFSDSFPEGLEISDYCLELLHDFGQRYTNSADCLVSNARPVKVCQNCYSEINSLRDIYYNISNVRGPGNVTCQDSLLRSDRLMLLYNLNNSLEDIWNTAECTNCLSEGEKNVSSTTLYFIDRLNQSLTCFEKHQQGNHSELCAECRTSYKILNELYSNMSKNKTLCIDVEDAINVTRHLWSTNFNCTLKREENVTIIAVSSFMLFLPIIFYLSNYLHSEQQKRKLIHPKRAKSSHSLMNIQDKYN